MSLIKQLTELAKENNLKYEYCEQSFRILFDLNGIDYYFEVCTPENNGLRATYWSSAFSHADVANEFNDDITILTEFKKILKEQINSEVYNNEN